MLLEKQSPVYHGASMLIKDAINDRGDHGGTERNQNQIVTHSPATHSRDNKVIG